MSKVHIVMIRTDAGEAIVYGVWLCEAKAEAYAVAHAKAFGYASAWVETHTIVDQKA